MTFSIPRPDWVSDALIADRGEHAGFQMYTREGNDAVADMVTTVIASAEAGLLRPQEVKDALREGVAEVGVRFPEIHDGEPEWAIVDVVNGYFDTVGFAPIIREDIF